MAKKLIMCIGLPGSGKTTWAIDQVLADKTGVCRVNKDDIRAALSATGWEWSPENEKDVIAQRDREIKSYLGKDLSCHTVISDDTNLGRKHKVALEAIAREAGAKFEIKDFTHVPISTCIERDAKRFGKGRVGPEVIQRMANQYHIGAVTHVEIKPYGGPDVAHAMSGIISDIDGTLALFDHRSPYETGKAGTDKINATIRTILEVYHRHLQEQIIYMSGREEKYRELTEDWMKRNHCPPGPLYMRPTGDFRKDWIVKYELFNKHIRGKYVVRFVLDDRNQVVEMWRKLGLTCLQVADGNF